MQHGSQWNAFFGNAEMGVDRVRTWIREGRPVHLPDEQMLEDKRHGCVAYEYGDVPVRHLVVSQLNEDKSALEFRSVYPLLKEGVTTVLELLDIHEDDTACEAVVECVNRHAVTFSFFDPFYCNNRATYRIGQKYEFSIAALAYSLENIEDTNIRITEGAPLELERLRVLEENPKADVSQIKFVNISMAQLRCLLPRDNGMDAEFQTIVEEVAFFQLEDTEICQMRVVLMRPADEDFRAMLYASEHVLKGYRPKVGDNVRGVLWLQGYPLRRIEGSESWADQVSAESPAHDWEGFDRAIAAQDYLADMHIGDRALGSSVARLGWDITKCDNPTGSPDVPTLLVQRGEQQVNLWIRAFIQGQEAELEFTPEEVARYSAESAKRGQLAAFVTVICTDVNSGHTFKYQGLESLELFTGKIGTTEYLPKPSSGADRV